MVDLGTIKKVDLREVWPNEATDFTPWLKENLRALGDALGMDLEFDQQEARVGGFSLDLLARDSRRDRPVVIENQLTVTNHDHPGKLLTHAGGYDAGVMIWLCREMREEHRQALDWLNQRTDENTEFFGVVVEALKIDDSRPAPNFRLVAFPNEWRKSNVRSDPSAASERMKSYRSFFQPLVDELRENYSFTNIRKAQLRSYVFFSSGFSGVEYGASFVQGGQARVEVYIDRDQDWNKRLFDELERAKDLLETGFFEPWEWERLDHRRASRISINRPGSIDDDPETLEEIKTWMMTNLLAVKKVFHPKLAEVVT